MFDSLKSKLKGIFSKADKKLDEEQIYGKEEEQSQPATPTETPTKPIQDSNVPAQEPAKAEPVKEQPKEEPKLSRKEMLKLQKKQKAAPEAGARQSENVVSDSGKKIKEAALDEILDEIYFTLLEADVAVPVADKIREGVKQNLLGRKYDRSYTLEEVVEMAVKDAIRDVLEINEFDFDDWITKQKKPTVIMFVGINGTGKTTAIAKIANRLQNSGKSVVLAACDTFRAGAIEQLTIHADRLGCKIVKQNQDADPAAVAYDAIEHAKTKFKDVVLVDTAGRMQTNSNLIEEMKKIVRVAKPDLKVFVGDSLAGNNAIEQAKVFDDAVGIDAVILTKIDTDAKGGAALSIAHTIGKPIAFVCNGQEYDDIVKFDTEWMIARMFDE